MRGMIMEIRKKLRDKGEGIEVSKKEIIVAKIKEERRSCRSVCKGKCGRNVTRIGKVGGEERGGDRYNY